MKVLLIAISLVLLAGCQHLNQQVAKIVPTVEVVEPDPQQYRLKSWLQQLSQAMEMNPEEVQKNLKKLGTKRPQVINQLYHYAVLNQQLKDRLGWIRARDSLRIIKADKQVSGEVEMLVNMLLLHNQSMINADARDSRMLDALDQNQIQLDVAGEALRESRQHSELLQNKIDALTNLERNMSIRRALTTDAEKERKGE
ncbi:MAG: hypothetical protein OQJ91_11235 [Motiliproteus sp.]|nr:hypothetical protein [Motiliproteus sp.]